MTESRTRTEKTDRTDSAWHGFNVNVNKNRMHSTRQNIILWTVAFVSTVHHSGEHCSVTKEGGNGSFEVFSAKFKGFTVHSPLRLGTKCKSGFAGIQLGGKRARAVAAVAREAKVLL